MTARRARTTAGNRQGVTRIGRRRGSSIRFGRGSGRLSASTPLSFGQIGHPRSGAELLERKLGPRTSKERRHLRFGIRTIPEGDRLGGTGLRASGVHLEVGDVAVFLP